MEHDDQMRSDIPPLPYSFESQMLDTQGFLFQERGVLSPVMFFDARSLMRTWEGRGQRATRRRRPKREGRTFLRGQGNLRRRFIYSRAINPVAEIEETGASRTARESDGRRGGKARGHVQMTSGLRGEEGVPQNQAE